MVDGQGIAYVALLECCVRGIMSINGFSILLLMLLLLGLVFIRSVLATVLLPNTILHDLQNRLNFVICIRSQYDATITPPARSPLIVRTA